MLPKSENFTDNQEGFVWVTETRELQTGMTLSATRGVIVVHEKPTEEETSTIARRLRYFVGTGLKRHIQTRDFTTKV